MLPHPRPQRDKAVAVEAMYVQLQRISPQPPDCILGADWRPPHALLRPPSPGPKSLAGSPQHAHSARLRLMTRHPRGACRVTAHTAIDGEAIFIHRSGLARGTNSRDAVEPLPLKAPHKAGRVIVSALSTAAS